MKIKQRFTIYNVIMLLTPIILIGCISAAALIIFVMKYPVHELELSRAALLNPVILIRALGDFFQKNPESLIYIILWLIICVAVFTISTTLYTRRLSKSLEIPVKRLTDAADEIKKGNLNFEVMGSNYDELDELCGSFEAMRQTLKAAAATEQRMKEERSMLLANISHDLKTPITSIKGYVDGLMDNVADTPEKQKRYLDTIYAKAQMLDSMINNLSTFSKLEMSRLDFDFSCGDINAFLEDLIEDYRLDLEKNNITLEAKLSEAPAYVRIDYEKMGRVFSNLINNAIKYKNGDNSTLEIQSYHEDKGIYITITDNGLGISEENLKKVFDSFYRVDYSRTISGSGLGLGIAKQIVEKHGGKLWLRSEGEGMGTTAVVYLPYEKRS